MLYDLVTHFIILHPAFQISSLSAFLHPSWAAKRSFIFRVTELPGHHLEPLISTYLELHSKNLLRSEVDHSVLFLYTFASNPPYISSVSLRCMMLMCGGVFSFLIFLKYFSGHFQRPAHLAKIYLSLLYPFPTSLLTPTNYFTYLSSQYFGVSSACVAEISWLVLL